MCVSFCDSTVIADIHCTIEFNSGRSTDDPVAHVINFCSQRGTTCNHMRLKPRMYFPLRNGDLIVLSDPKGEKSSPASSVTIMFESLCDTELSEFEKSYVIVGDPLGRGASAEVRRCRDRRTGEVFAVKIVQLKKFTSKKALERVKNEATILRSLSHKNVVKQYKCMEDSRNLYIVLELFV